MPAAVSYYRVSSDTQVRDGHGLEGQRMSCHSFARDKGFEIIAEFQDEGVSGGVLQRPGLLKLFAYLDQHPEVEACICDDLDRTARGLEVHFQIRNSLLERNVRPLYVNQCFDDSPAGRLMENIQAATKQFERENNRERVISRMKNRFRAGFWLFAPPFGYEYHRSPAGKNIRPKEPGASIAREALEGFASGRFVRMEDVRQFVAGRLPLGQGYRAQQAKRLMTRHRLYAGVMSTSEWPDVGEVQGLYDPLIRPDVSDAIAHRLNEKPRSWRVRRVRPDFPLKRHLRCGVCGGSLTSSYSTGRTGERYPYYRCYRKGCPTGSISNEVMEEELAKLLHRLVPRPDLAKLFLQQIKEAWSGQTDLYKEKIAMYRKELAEVDKSIEKLINVISQAKDNAIQMAYEVQIKKLTVDRGYIQYAMNNAQKPVSPGRIESIIKISEYLLCNPLAVWQTGESHKRDLLLKILFPDGLQYDKEKGLENAPNPLTDALFAVSKMENSHMVEHPQKFWKQFIISLEKVLRDESVISLLHSVSWQFSA